MRILVHIFLGYFLFWPAFSFAQNCILTDQFVYETAISKSEDLQLAQLRLQEMQSELLGFDAMFDTRLDTRLSHQIDQSDRVITVFGTRNDITAFETQLSKRFDMGLQLQGGFRHQRDKTDAPFAVINPAYNSIWFAKASMPFLNASHKNNQILRQSFDYQVESTSLENQYLKQQIGYDALQLFTLWIQAQKELALSEEALQRATDYHKTTKKLHNMGLVEKSSLHASESNISARKTDLLQTKENFEILDQQIKHILQKPLSEQCSYKKIEQINIKPVDQYKNQLDNRQDFQSIDKQIQSIETALAAYEKNLLPALEAFTSLELNDVEGNFSNSLEGTFSSYHPNFTVGGTLSVPFGKSAAKSSIEKAKVQKRILETQHQKRKREAQRDIQNVWTSIDLLYKRVSQTQETLGYESSKIKATQSEFELGRESFLTLLLYEQDFIQIKRQLLQINTQLQTQLFLIELLSGDLG